MGGMAARERGGQTASWRGCRTHASGLALVSLRHARRGQGRGRRRRSLTLERKLGALDSVRMASLASRDFVACAEGAILPVLASSDARRRSTCEARGATQSNPR